MCECSYQDNVELMAILGKGAEIEQQRLRRDEEERVFQHVLDDTVEVSDIYVSVCVSDM